MLQKTKPLPYKLLKIKWQDRSPDIEVLKRAGLRWTGHVTTIHYERFPKKVLCGELQVGKRSQGGQKKRCKDILEACLNYFDIPTVLWELAQDQAKWRGLIKRGAGEYQAKRISEVKQERTQRKARAKEQTYLVLSSTGRLELRLVPSAIFPVSIVRKSISGRHRPVRVADGPMTARCRFM